MLISTNAIANGNNRPVFNMWVGNFFEPYYSDLWRFDNAVADLKKMGFNTISLDSKLSDDFVNFYAGGESSQYIKGQRYLADVCAREGMGLTYLALFNGGDNLYPDIRDYPPTFIDQPRQKNGNLIRGYRHWSTAQQDAKASLLHLTK